MTFVSDGYPLRRLLMTSKALLLVVVKFVTHDAPPFQKSNIPLPVLSGRRKILHNNDRVNLYLDIQVYPDKRLQCFYVFWERFCSYAAC